MLVGALLASVFGLVPDQPAYSRYASTAFSQVATLPFIVAGATLAFQAGGGLYWLVPGIAFTLLDAVVEACCCWWRSSAGAVVSRSRPRRCVR